MTSPRDHLKRVLLIPLRTRPVARLCARAAAARGHGLVLIYHRVVDDNAPPGADVVPTVREHVLREHLRCLSALGDIVPLEELAREPAGRRRARFAVTFDDDYRSHVTHALPALQEVGAPATFFLSGRDLHDLGPYWFERLDSLVAEQGLTSACRTLGVQARTAGDLAAACERDPRLQAGLLAGGSPPADHLDAEDIRRLVAAGMGVGFHTVDHPLLTNLSRDEIDEALSRGRRELEAAAGAPARLFAYPHGKASTLVAERTRLAGFRGSWTGSPAPARRDDDPFLRGRWEPGPLSRDHFLASVSLRLHRSAPAGNGYRQLSR